MSDGPEVTLKSFCNPAIANATCNYNVGSNNFLTGDVEYSSYGYNVWEWNAIIFVAVFGLFTLLHLGLAVWARQYWLIYTLVFGCIGELIGWGGRLWSAVSKEWIPDSGGYWYSNDTAFLMQISTLIIAPAFLAACNYILLGRIIPILGAKYTFIHPLSYTVVFIVGDIISLIVQAVGGGTASAADTLEGANNGGYIMVGGVMFQILVMVCYTIVLLTFVLRWRSQKPFSHQIELFNWWPNALRTKKYKKYPQSRSQSTTELSSINTVTPGQDAAGLTVGEKVGEGYEATVGEVRGAKIMLTACLLSTLFIFIRSIYRSIELIDGWNGPIIENQPLFNFLDGMLIAFAVAVFVLAHPGRFLPRRDRRRL